MEEVSKLTAMNGFSFNSIAKIDFIQRNIHGQRGKYDKLQPTSANGVRNTLFCEYSVNHICRMHAFNINLYLLLVSVIELQP
ncbi:Hypothetical predicted protein [Octopus vulgaris]|uniref:Uncharacterized protein n=1 Tax=Octopus vulgaris TaxID=6645 RepID=A0AA36F376_OCTVU|nr:Hypothetical predicted protein [Octopus vulgaris]